MAVIKYPRNWVTAIAETEMCAVGDVNVKENIVSFTDTYLELCTRLALCCAVVCFDDVMIWNRFQRYLPFARRTH